MNIREVLLEKTTLKRLIGDNLVNDDENLANYGLSSLNLITLVSSIEDTFEIEYPLEYLTIDSFKTINIIVSILKTIIDN